MHRAFVIGLILGLLAHAGRPAVAMAAAGCCCGGSGTCCCAQGASAETTPSCCSNAQHGAGCQLRPASALPPAPPTAPLLRHDLPLQVHAVRLGRGRAGAWRFDPRTPLPSGLEAAPPTPPPRAGVSC